MTRTLHASPVRYVRRSLDAGEGIDVNDVFNAMTEDLLHDGDVELAMQKAFRWGFQDDEGEQVPGLRNLMQRLREDRLELLERLKTRESALPSPDTNEGGSDDGAPAMDAPAADAATELSQASIKSAAQMETMERSLRQIEDLDDLRGLDPEIVQDVLTDQERQWMEQWAQMRGTLASEGLVLEVGDRLELTPQAVRRIGEHALRAMFSSLRDGDGGDHDTRRRGHIGVTADTSSPWQYGDAFALDLSRTIMNSIRRQGAGAPVRLSADDFEIFDRESRTATATVLLIDMSRSMFYNGCWDAAKRAALALDTLMRGQFQRDDLAIAGFSERAERLTFMQLPSLEWNQYSHGTNLEDGLRLGRELLRPHKGKTRQILVITDGEPTAYKEGREVIFENPPTTRTFDATLREVLRCTRENITINTFLLEESPLMAEFVDQMARVNRGRVLHAAPRHLGRYLLRDFLSQRTTHLR